MVKRLVLCVAMLALFAASGTAEVAKRTDSWTTLDVPAEHSELGRVYYVKFPPHSAQVTFASETPIERIIGTSNAVVGYVVAEIENDNPTGRILAGAFRLPVKSFDTGIQMRNGHLQGQFFLDANEFPEIQVAIKGSDEVVVKNKDDASATFTTTLDGELTIKGVTKPGRVPAKVTFLKGSEDTKAAGAGDVLSMRCSYSVKRSEYNVGPGFLPADLADEMEIDQFIVLTTVSADEETRQKGGDPVAQKFTVLYQNFNDKDGAFEMADAFLKNHHDNADALSALAWGVVLTDNEDKKCQKYAMTAAMRAVELTKEANADMLALVAYLYSERREFEKAVEWQRKAVAYKDSSENPEAIEQMMKRYEGMLASTK